MGTLFQTHTSIIHNNNKANNAVQSPNLGLKTKWQVFNKRLPNTANKIIKPMPVQDYKGL